MYQDKTLVCKECGKEFVFTAGEQEFYAEKGFQNEPQVAGGKLGKGIPLTLPHQGGKPGIAAILKLHAAPLFLTLMISQSIHFVKILFPGAVIPGKLTTFGCFLHHYAV